MLASVISEQGEVGDGIYVALISAIGLILAAVLQQIVKSRSQSNERLDTTIQNQTTLNNTLADLNRTLVDIDKRLVAVETTVSYFHPPPSREPPLER